MEKYPTLLKKDLRKNLFQLFVGWSGQFSKFLGPYSLTVQANANDNDEELQYAALQVQIHFLQEHFFLIKYCD